MVSSVCFCLEILSWHESSLRLLVIPLERCLAADLSILNCNGCLISEKNHIDLSFLQVDSPVKQFYTGLSVF
jgi:hypothetical protein